MSHTALETMQVVVIHTDGEWELVDVPKRDDGKLLQWFQEAVGGYVEVVELPTRNGKRAMLWVNDDIRAIEAPMVNWGATALATFLGSGGPYVGTAIVTGARGSNCAPVPEFIVELLRNEITEAAELFGKVWAEKHVRTE